MKAKGDHQIHPFTAEFRLAAVERCFRNRVAVEAARHTATSLTIGAIFFVAFSFSDLASLGLRPAFFILLAARVLASGFALAVAAMVRRRPRLATTGAWTCAAELLFLAAFFLVAGLRPAEVSLHGMSMLVILLTYYLFIPNRFLLALAISLAGTAVFIAMLPMLLYLDLSSLTAIILLLCLVNTFGTLVMRRQSIQRRQEYRQLEAEREANRLLAHEIGERRRLQEELSRMARTDALTGLLNRRHYMDLSDLALKQARRFRRPVAVIFMDVDNFKQINDTRGHVAGDEALRTIAAVCRDTLREIDIIGRFGGEEFAVTLPQCNLKEAMRAAERLRERLGTSTVISREGAFHFTVSIGVAAVAAGSGSIVDALHVADNALYEGKNSGRNRVVAAGLPSLHGDPQRSRAE